MTAGHALGLDLGGGSARCLLLDLSTGVWHCEARTVRPRPAAGLAGLGFDLDLSAIETAIGETVRGCLQRARVDPATIAGIACTSQRHSTVVLDAEGAVLLATPNRDARAAGPGLRLAADHGAELHALSGHWPLPIFAAARLQWLRDERPQDYERAHRALTASEWLAWRLSGVAAADPTHAGESLLFALADRTWSHEWMARLGLSPSLFPPPAEPGTRLGELRPAAAAWLGLQPGTPVAAGAADTQSGLLGCGALEPGRVVAVAGTTTPVQRVLSTPRVDPDARVWTGQHVLPGTRVLESNAGPMGDAIDWLARLLHPGDRQPVARFLAEATHASAAPTGAISTLGADVMNARAPAMPWATIGLSPMAMPDGEAARESLSRTVVEGIACALRANAEQLSAVAGGPPVGALCLAGGLSRSRGFAQIAANLCDTPLEVAGCSEASALGAALCGAVASGAFADLESAAQVLVPDARAVEPASEARTAAAETYEAWLAQRDAMAPATAAGGQRATGAALRRADSAAGAPAPARSVRILATAQLDPASRAVLATLGTLTYASYRDAGRLLRETALVEALAGFEVFVTEVDVVGAEALAQLPDLRVIVSCRGDAVNVDVDAATVYGIPVINTPGRNADAVADLTVAFLLMLSRNLSDATQFLRTGDITGGDLAKFGEAYARFHGHELWGSTVGLVGLGAVGRQVAARLGGFGVRLLVSDPFIDPEQAARAGAEHVDLDELLEVSDYVSLHAPVNDATRGLIGREALARMKPSASLINTARAALVDETALADALAQNRLAGAALDVFSVEPPGSDHPLLALPNVLATPHMGGNTVEVSAHQGRIVAQELARLLRGESPQAVLNPAVLETFDWEQPRPIPTGEALAALSKGTGPAVTDLERDANEST